MGPIEEGKGKREEGQGKGMKGMMFCGPRAGFRCHNQKGFGVVGWKRIPGPSRGSDLVRCTTWHCQAGSRKIGREGRERNAEELETWGKCLVVMRGKSYSDVEGGVARRSC